MGRWTYYSPLGLGVLLVLLLNDSLRASVPTYAPAVQWLIVAAYALGAALAAQVLMIGAQGAFAQVLPVPRGRSIRGGAAVSAGWLFIAWVVLGLTTALLYSEEIGTAALVLGVCDLAALAGALGIYFWNIPAALPDFLAERRTLIGRD
jgi:hypothetical protein